jgi:hypothetical protein
VDSAPGRSNGGAHGGIALEGSSVWLGDREDVADLSDLSGEHEACRQRIETLGHARRDIGGGDVDAGHGLGIYFGLRISLREGGTSGN